MKGKGFETITPFVKAKRPQCRIPLLPGKGDHFFKGNTLRAGGTETVPCNGIVQRLFVALALQPLSGYIILKLDHREGVLLKYLKISPSMHVFYNWVSLFSIKLFL